MDSRYALPFTFSVTPIRPVTRPTEKPLPADLGKDDYAPGWLVQDLYQPDYIEKCKNPKVFDYFYGLNVPTVLLSELKLNLRNISEKEKTLLIDTVVRALLCGDVKALNFFITNGMYNDKIEILQRLNQYRNSMSTIERHYVNLYDQNFQFRLAMFQDETRDPTKGLEIFDFEVEDSSSQKSVVGSANRPLHSRIRYFRDHLFNRTCYPITFDPNDLNPFEYCQVKDWCNPEIYHELVKLYQEGEYIKFQDKLDTLCPGPGTKTLDIQVQEILFYSTKKTFPQMMQMFMKHQNLNQLQVSQCINLELKTGQCIDLALKTGRDDQVIYFIQHGAEYKPDKILETMVSSDRFGYVELLNYLIERKLIHDDPKELFLKAVLHNFELTKHLVQHYGIDLNVALPNPAERFSLIDRLLLEATKYTISCPHWQLAHYLIDQGLDLRNSNRSFDASIIFRLIEAPHTPEQQTLLLNLLIKLHHNGTNLFTLREGNKCIFDYAKWFSKEILRFLLEEAPEEKTADKQPTLRERVLRENSLWNDLIPKGDFEALDYLHNLYVKRQMPLDLKQLQLTFQSHHKLFLLHNKVHFRRCDPFRLKLLENKEMADTLFSQYIQPADFMMTISLEMHQDLFRSPNKNQEQLVRFLVETHGVNPIYPKKDLEDKDRTMFNTTEAQFLIHIYRDYFDKCYDHLNTLFVSRMPRDLIDLIFDQLCDMPYFNLQEYLKHRKQQRDPLQYLPSGKYSMETYYFPFVRDDIVCKETDSKPTMMQDESDDDIHESEIMDTTQPLHLTPPAVNGSSLSLSTDEKSDAPQRMSGKKHAHDDDPENNEHPSKKRKRDSAPEKEEKSGKEEKVSPSSHHSNNGKGEKKPESSSSSSSNLMKMFAMGKRDYSTMSGPSDDQTQPDNDQGPTKRARLN